MANGDQSEIPVPGRPPAAAIAVAIIFAAILIYAMGRILAPFATPILLAIIVVTFTFPFYRKLRAKMKGHDAFAASLMLLIVTFTIILPAFFMLLLVINEATTLFQAIHQHDIRQTIASLEIDRVLEWIHGVVPWIDPATLDVQGMIVGTVEKIPGWVATYGGRFVASLTNVALNFVFMLLAAYFFYLEGETVVKKVRDLSPLPDEYEAIIATKFTGVINATFRGQILTAIAQGAATAVGLLIVGVQGAVFWGAVAAVTALIPVVGAAAVWVPATLYLFAVAAIQHTSMVPAIVLAVWGVAVVSLIDNLIRPWAMRSGTNMSAILLLFSILGGVRAFGILGLILGPLVFVLLLTMIEMYENLFAPMKGRVSATADAGESAPGDEQEG